MVVAMQLPIGARSGLALPQCAKPRRVLVARAQDGENRGPSGNDSYSKIEAPVRPTTPDAKLYGGKPVQERNWGQEDLNPELRDNTPEWKPPGSDISAADAWRFTGAIPEVANARLAMLGVVAALGAELGAGLNVFEQWSTATVPIIGTFFLFTLATAVPVFRGVPRRGNAVFTPGLELSLGRVAMVGFLGLVISTFYKGSALWFL